MAQVQQLMAEFVYQQIGCVFCRIVTGITLIAAQFFRRRIFTDKWIR